MKIIISPTKRMIENNDCFVYQALPIFLDEANVLLDNLKKMSYHQLKSIYQCNDNIALVNYERIGQMDLKVNLTPALFAYEGLAFQHIRPNVCSDDQLAYLQDNLRILSAFYGILKPFDGIVSYRLEMGCDMVVGDYHNLYDFWGCKIFSQLVKDDNIILNLASKEYYKVISKYVSKDVKFVTCVFLQDHFGKYVEKGTVCKMARGEMVRYLAVNKIDNFSGVKKFSELGFYYSEELSNDEKIVFIKE
ncbi:MAG: peroxide stress protein YaaA [Erysipelotrichaceae bacterium]